MGMHEELGLDELQVVSDLHLGGQAGFQIFASTAELAWLADSVAASPVPGLAALLINGDFVDFLAEQPAAGFDAAGALTKLERVAADPAFAPVFAAFRRLLATPRRLLVVNLGNHDLELALPAVRARLAALLAGDDAAARNRLLWIGDGTGFRCRVGNAAVLCLHGNECDSWNVTDFERLRRIARDLQYGRQPEPWMPNAGSQLVVEVMNAVKSRYPFVDLLKPETEAVLPMLAALDPALLRKLQDIGGIARRKAVDMVRMATGFLNADGADAPDAARDGAASAGALPLMPINGALPLPGFPGQSAAALMARAETAFQQGVAPITLVRTSQGEQLGLFGAAWDWMTGKPRHELLREALEYLDKDRSFDFRAPDATFRSLDALVGDGVQLLLAGHTHLERSLPRQRGGGHYFNSGTWAGLIRIDPALRQDAARFARLYRLLDDGHIATLEAEPGLVRRPNTVVAAWRDGAGCRAELRHVQAGDDGYRAEPVPGSQRRFGG